MYLQGRNSLYLVEFSQNLDVFYPPQKLSQASTQKLYYICCFQLIINRWKAASKTLQKDLPVDIASCFSQLNFFSDSTGESRSQYQKKLPRKTTIIFKNYIPWAIQNSFSLNISLISARFFDVSVLNFPSFFIDFFKLCQFTAKQKTQLKNSQLNIEAL